VVGHNQFKGYLLEEQDMGLWLVDLIMFPTQTLRIGLVSGSREGTPGNDAHLCNSHSSPLFLP
jgi:hypothetical protein